MAGRAGARATAPSEAGEQAGAGNWGQPGVQGIRQGHGGGAGQARNTHQV